MNLLTKLEAWPKRRVEAVSAASIVALGLLDYFSGYQLSVNALYLLPIFALSWVSGRRAGIAGSAGAAIMRQLVDTLGGRTYPSIAYPIWSVGRRFLMFLVVALLAATLREFVDKQRALARVDHLTGAANKRAFEELLSAEIDRSRRYRRPFTLAYMDLDNFKAVNDSFGHDVGDKVLQRVVGVVRSHVRASDVVGRLGGDEFGLLLPEADEAAARAAVSKIQSEFAAEMRGLDWPVTVSIGSVTLVANGQDPSTLLDEADRLMYAAKIKGRASARTAALARAEDA